MLVHHGKDPDPPGSAQVSQKTFLHALSSSIYKTCLFLLWFLGYGYSRHQTVAPHIADIFICTFLEIQQGDHLVSVDRIGILVALPSICPIFGLFVHSPAPPLSSTFRSYLWGSLYGTGTILVIPSQFPPHLYLWKLFTRMGKGLSCSSFTGRIYLLRM